MGGTLWRRVSTEDPNLVRLKKVEGWKHITIACGLEPAQWRQVYEASRRNVDPLPIRYDAFDQPWAYVCVVEEWKFRNDRSARAYDLERRLKKAPRDRRGKAA